ncbi:zinc finger CCCH domain-containing protein [Striga asiatica]|uniref:Zinc finger CCCH domain-containing protein n=1 Tax=Striga asiatica TaxID=4170 RepID=A0A5A7Q3X4_STRAF|nr:zinc finger CCCH domain-containing protein [Striga asiatica]
MEYYDIIKKKEGFKLADIYAAKNRVKAKKYYQPNDDDEESDDEDDDYEEERLSDYDGLEEEESKKKGTHNISKRHRFTKQRPFNKSNKKEFIGWASRPLIEFLNSIGKNSTEKLSPFDVTSIVNKYVKENNLLNPGKRKSITCDERLLCLFGKKKIAKYKVFDLVEDHFAENQESDEDEIGYNSEDNNRETENACKRQRKIGIKKIPQEKIKEIDMPLSRFACIGVENIKLVYLRRGVLKEMLKEPESFEEKVSGCFVRVKSEPYDYRSRKSHQLIQVKGVKALPTEENTTEAILLLSAMPEEIRVSLLADEDFTEEECEELKNKILAGEVERPTVDFLQQRVNAIHKDVTNYWIHKELRLLKNRADLANEKGWRAEYPFMSFWSTSRLLENVPTVMRDVYEPDDGEVNRDKLDSPDTGLDEYAQHNKHAKAKGRYSNVAVIDVESDDNLPTDQKTEADTENETWLMKGPNGERTDSSLSLLRLWSGSNVYASKFMVWRKGEKEENAIPLMEALTLAGRSK